MSHIRDQISRAAGMRVLHTASQTITLVKAEKISILPTQKDALLKRMDDLDSELGRMVKLLREMRVDVLHLSD